MNGVTGLLQNKVFFIFTPIDTKYQDALTHYAPSLGLVALENYLYIHNISVEIIDGSVIYSKEEIIDLLLREKPLYVGQSVQLISYKNSLEIASVVHSYGGRNVLGGHHATQMCDAIMTNHGDIIDYIIVGDGELAWYSLLLGVKIPDIPNIVYKSNGVIYHNRILELDLNSLPTIDYSRIDLTPYMHNLSKSNFSDNVYTNYLRVYSHKGCGNRINGNGCIFCGRADRNVRFKSPQNFWRDILHCVNEQNADYIFDVGDDFLFSTQFLVEMLEIKPKNLKKYDMGIFGRANRITPYSSELLRKIGVVDVTIGFESGDNFVLKNCNKAFSSPEQNINAVDYLTREGIDITASYVLGMPGETKESVKNTIANAKKVVEMINKRLGRQPKELVANLLEPTPGSPAYKALVNAYPEKYYLKDFIDLEEMQRDYFKLFFGLDTLQKYLSFRSMLSEAAKEIHSMVGFSDAQGWLSQEI